MQDSPQIRLYDYVFYIIVHKAGYYCSGNSRATEQWAGFPLMVTALH